MKQAITIVTVGLLVLFLSCRRELSCESCGGVNQPPIAKAGRDTTISLPVDSILLDGSASTDPDGSITAYQWEKIAGPASANLITPAVAKTSVKALQTGVYQFELTITDNGGLSAKDTVQITVNNPAVNQPPQACAGADQTIVLPANTVTLDATCSTDPDLNLTKYRWRKIAGSSFTSTDTTAAVIRLSNLLEGVYRFEVRVTDAGGLFSTDTVQVDVRSGTTVGCTPVNDQVINASLQQIGTLTVPRMPAAGAVGNKIVFAGGWSAFSCSNGQSLPAKASSAVDIFNVPGYAHTTAQLSVARAGIRSVACEGKLFFAGGEDAAGKVYDNIDVYDASAGTWRVMHLSEPRAYVATAVLGSKVFFAGGNTGPTIINAAKWTSKVDIYDLATDRWTTVTLPSPASGMYSVTVAGTKVYFTGSGSANRVDVYDDATGSWSGRQLQVPWLYLAARPTFTMGNNVYWAATVDTLICNGNGICEDGLAGKLEMLNTVSGSTTIASCTPAFYHVSPIIRGQEVAFLSTSAGKIDIGSWGVSGHFIIFNAATGAWYRANANFSFQTLGYDTGLTSSNNVLYVGGGSDFTPNNCVGATNGVYILNW